jgi:predicted  nucleic acid-binding Zn-ribbon protein
MKKLLLGVVSLLLLRLGGFAAEVPVTPPPDQAATEALHSLEGMIERGEVGWWKSQADPSIQFLNKYGGLGSDTVAALSLNQAEQLWPAWKPVGAGLERFGIACSVYNCLKSANDGNYNAAVLNALKDFLKYRLSKMGDAVATSAAGVGLIDFALNSFGEAALQQVADDYWFFYCRYQAQRQPRLADYVRLITQGDGAHRGFDAVVASLDSFWDDPETHGIRGFSTLKTQDPDYKANFRSRYLKENLLPFLQTWAERERDREQMAAWIALQRLTEQLQSTVVSVDFALLEKGLNEPPPGATVDVVVEFYSPKQETRVLAQAPIAPHNRLQFPLSAALGENRQLPRSLKIRLHRADETEATRNSGTTTFELAWTNQAGPWRREVKPGLLAYTAKTPLFTSTWSEFPITLTGEGADKIYSLVFRRLPVGTATNLREVASSPGGHSADMKNGQGKMRLEHGVYLVNCENDIYVFAHGPVKIAGPAALTIPVRRAAEQAPAAPDLAAYRTTVNQAAEAVRQRQESQRAAIAEASQVLQEYWLGTYNAINGYMATARALQKKLNDEQQQPGLTSEQQQAIRARYQPRIAEMEKAKDTTERAMWEVTREEEKVADDISTETRVRHEAARKELNTARDELGQALNEVRQKLYPLGSEFEKLANRVSSGALQAVPHTSLDGELAQMRESLKKIEADLPVLLQANDRVAGLQTRYNEAVAVARDIEVNEGQTIYFNPTDYDGEIAMLGLRVDAIRNSGYVEQAKTVLQRAERVVEKRRERARLTVAMKQEIEALAAQFPLPDETLWRERTAQFRSRADALFAAAGAADGADDTGALRQLQQDFATFFQEQVAVCGDLLEAPATTPTAYSRFREKYEEFNRLQLYREITPDFWANMEQLVWSKIRARLNATVEAMAISSDVNKWLKAGATRAARAQRLATVREALDSKQPAGDVATQVEQLNRLEATLRELPARLVTGERQAWDAARTRLARSGQLDAWLRTQTRPYVQFTALNEKPVEQGFVWPEVADRGTPQTEQGLPVSIALKNVADDAMCLMQESSDGGKTWRNTTYYGGRWRAYLRWEGQEQRFRALLPDGELTLDLPAFPHYLPPRT